jgi:hypothetical protein
VRFEPEPDSDADIAVSTPFARRFALGYGRRLEMKLLGRCPSKSDPIAAAELLASDDRDRDAFARWVWTLFRQGQDIVLEPPTQDDAATLLAPGDLVSYLRNVIAPMDSSLPPLAENAQRARLVELCQHWVRATVLSESDNLQAVARVLRDALSQPDDRLLDQVFEYEPERRDEVIDQARVFCDQALDSKTQSEADLHLAEQAYQLPLSRGLIRLLLPAFAEDDPWVGLLWRGRVDLDDVQLTPSSRFDARYREQLTCARDSYRLACMQLASPHVRLSISLARRGERGSFMDRVREGNLALVGATTAFDYRPGYKFGTYAVHWIWTAMDLPGSALDLVPSR